MTRGTACDKGVRMCRKALLAQSRVTTVGTRTWQRLSRDGWTHVGPSVCPLTTCGRAARSLQSRLPNLTRPFQTGGSDGTRHPFASAVRVPAPWSAERAGGGRLGGFSADGPGRDGDFVACWEQPLRAAWCAHGGDCAWSLRLVLEGPPGLPGPGRRPRRVDVASSH